MNQYGRTAQEHWSRFLPGRVADLAAPTRFFEQLGEEVATQVVELATTLAGEDPPGESYLQKVGRLSNARQRAEEITLRQLVLLPPEPGSPMDEDSDPAEPPTGQRSAVASGWHPVREDPDDSFWRSQDD